jgi:fructose-bisphosphate aldolase class I
MITPGVRRDGPSLVSELMSSLCNPPTQPEIRVEEYRQLSRHRVVLEATLLKANMVLPGAESDTQTSDDQIARATLKVPRRTVPTAVPGILFLCGGQSDEQADRAAGRHQQAGTATVGAELLVRPGAPGADPEGLGRDDANHCAAQAALLNRARLDGAARRGAYTPDLEGSVLVGAAPVAPHWRRI